MKRKPPSKKEPEAAIRAFSRDHRNNPALHNLYVTWAYQNLEIAKGCLEALAERSQVSASIMANALRVAMNKEITEDAAYFEAAALLFAGLKPPMKPPQN